MLSQSGNKAGQSPQTLPENHDPLQTLLCNEAAMAKMGMRPPGPIPMMYYPEAYYRGLRPKRAKEQQIDVEKAQVTLTNEIIDW